MVTCTILMAWPSWLLTEAVKQTLFVHRWSEAFSGFMPPFKSWMPPKVIAKAAAWGDRMLGSDMSASATELSNLKYSFPDALPKVHFYSFDVVPAVCVCRRCLQYECPAASIFMSAGGLPMLAEVLAFPMPEPESLLHVNAEHPGVPLCHMLQA